MYAVIMEPKREYDRDDFDIRKAATDVVKEMAKKGENEE